MTLPPVEKTECARPRTLGNGGARRKHLALLLVASVVVLSFNFTARRLLTNDDTRFPVMARDVLAHGHWLLPALPNGLPHLAKPPLVVWLIALASLPLGAVSVTTAILPSLLEAVGVVFLTYWIGRRLFDPEVGIVAGFIVVTTVGVFSFAHSAMPDMAQLVAIMGAMAAYVAWEYVGVRAGLIGFYGLVGVACLTKGAAGLLPLAIVMVDTIRVHGFGGLRRLWSPVGLLLLPAIAVPWWVIAAVVGRDRFAEDILLKDQLLWYVGRWHWSALSEPVVHAVAITLPWCIALPLAVRRARREADPAKTRRIALLLVWLATVFVILAVSNQQRERYYLPLCPAVALVIGWWYSTFASRRRAWAFVGTWLAVVMVGAGSDAVHTRHFNAATDLDAARAALDGRPGPVYAVDVPELALTFNLNRPVLVSADYRFFQERLPADGHLIISDRALADVQDRSCMRQLANGVMDRQAFALVVKTACTSSASRIR